MGVIGLQLQQVKLLQMAGQVVVVQVLQQLAQAHQDKVLLVELDQLLRLIMVVVVAAVRLLLARLVVGLLVAQGAQGFQMQLQVLPCFMRAVVALECRMVARLVLGGQALVALEVAVLRRPLAAPELLIQGQAAAVVVRQLHFLVMGELAVKE